MAVYFPKLGETHYDRVFKHYFLSETGLGWRLNTAHGQPTGLARHHNKPNIIDTHLLISNKRISTIEAPNDTTNSQNRHKTVKRRYSNVDIWLFPNNNKIIVATYGTIPAVYSN